MHITRHRARMNEIAKILVAFSIILLIYGAFLDYNEKNKLYNPITDATEINSEDNQTTIDINTSGKTKKEVNNGENRSINNDTIEETNNSLRKQIESTYEIKVMYGEETKDYEVGGLKAIPITDANIINASLTKLNTVLSLYPSGLFQEINNGGIPLTVYLIDKYSTSGVTGVTDSTSYYANISIATAYPFEESFFHESYHYIERYMFDKKYLVFNNWNGYNPDGFTYGTTNNSYSYASNGKREDSYFVNNYAQTAETEDRASTFEYMMDLEKASCLNENQPVWKKAKLMSQAMDAAFESCSPYETEYWERFL